MACWRRDDWPIRMPGPSLYKIAVVGREPALTNQLTC
jgi:hypothetical protein